MPQHAFIAGVEALRSRNRSWLRGLLAAAVCGFALFVLQPAGGAAELRPRIAVVAFGLFGDQSVFESEAQRAAQILADHFGARPVIVRANSRTRTEATVEALAAALDSAAKGLDPDNDVLAVILSSHGSRAGLTIKPAGGREDILWPAVLSAMLDRTGVRHRVVIISACYSGVFIPLLANTATLVITAADADHMSFGCQDGALWTYFGEAFFDIAMRRTTSFKGAFELARGLVRERELRGGFVPSNPQMAGGESFEPRLKGIVKPDEASAPIWGPWQPAQAGVQPWPMR